MTADIAKSVQPAALRDAPHDYDTAQNQDGWRDGLAWPVCYRETFDSAMTALQAIVASVQAIEEPDLKDTVLLALGMIYGSALPKAEAALAVQHERDFGLRLQGNAPELAFLRGETDAAAPVRDLGSYRLVQQPPAAFARRLARTWSWTPWWHMAQSMLRPSAIAISHNGLLRQAATAARVKFHHADSIFRAAQDETISGTADWRSVVDTLTRALTDAYRVDPETRERLDQLVAAQASAFLEVASRDIAALRAARDIPHTIWAGSGGYWPSRAVSIETLRRGGEVSRFDHGGGMGLNALQPLWAMTELLVSSRYTLPTPKLAERVESSGGREFIPTSQRLEFAGGAGDPLHRAAAQIAPTKSPGPRRITYTPVSLIGFRQLTPPRLPDLVSLDWQMRFTGMLKDLPVRLTCRPHPAGIFQRRANPLAAVTPLSGTVFEDLIADTDVFVFDYIQSTTFYEALCTDRPIVLIDFGLPVYTGDARAMLEARCRIVNARFDEFSRPHVDRDELKAAICAGPDAADPTVFRSFLVGGSA